MQFRWDEQKRIENLRKHGVDFRDAARLFEGITSSIADDRKNYSETRWISIGLLNGIAMVCVHTESKNTIRVISMRKATRYEAEKHFEEVRDQLG